MGSVAATLPKGGFPLKDQHVVGRSVEELGSLLINIQVRRRVTLWMLCRPFQIVQTGKPTESLAIY